MEMKWSPEILGGLFCDRKDMNGIYYWYDAIEEKKRWLKLAPKAQMKVTYEHL